MNINSDGLKLRRKLENDLPISEDDVKNAYEVARLSGRIEDRVLYETLKQKEVKEDQGEKELPAKELSEVEQLEVDFEKAYKSHDFNSVVDLATKIKQLKSDSAEQE